MNHPLHCRCGKLRGEVAHPERATRALCYCHDCQAFAHVLGQPGQVLDAMGGTDIVAIAPRYVSFTQGLENLACLSLTPNGLLRWYARCCNTPVANTPRDFKLSHAGIIHNCIDDPARPLEADFGPVKMRVNTKGARGRPPSQRLGSFIAVLGYMASLQRARLSGSYKVNPFFDAATGRPVREPRILTAAERDQAMKAVAAFAGDANSGA